jgi:hypothetical protein
MVKIQTIALLLVAIAIGITGCTSSDENDSVSLNVVLASTFVDEERAESFASVLNEALPAYSDDTKSISVTGISSGDASTDPFSVMAGTTRIGGLMASREIELWISDSENALRYADDGENYVTLDSLFTEEELSSFTGTLVRIPKLDDEGNATGEFSEYCGVDLSGNGAVRDLTGIADPQMFIITGSPNMDAAKAAFLYLATL